MVASYTLLERHVITAGTAGAVLLETGTVVGDNTPYAVASSTPSMKGNDAASEALVDALHTKIFAPNVPGKTPTVINQQVPGFYTKRTVKAK